MGSDLGGCGLFGRLKEIWQVIWEVGGDLGGWRLFWRLKEIWEVIWEVGGDFLEVIDYSGG